MALTRVRAISDPSEVSDPAYAEGLRAAVAAAVGYGIQTTGREGSDPPIPVALLAQARMAARVGIPLDTVLRRYFAGYSLLGYFILEEASRAGMSDGDELKRLLGTHAGLFDRLLEAVGEEHGRESEALTLATGTRRLAERIERLLAGEHLDTAEIPYEFDGWHVGVAASGPADQETVRALAEPCDCRLLSPPRETEVLWAWLGTRRAPEESELDRLTSSPMPEGVSLALGEPGQGLAGWRLTHRQALAALPVETLRAYFAAGRNASSAAAALGVRRHTVSSRLGAIEKRIERPLEICVAEVWLALRLDDLREGTMVGEVGSG